jgi:hypothetical protein
LGAAQQRHHQHAPGTPRVGARGDEQTGSRHEGERAARHLLHLHVLGMVAHGADDRLVRAILLHQHQPHAVLLLVLHEQAQQLARVRLNAGDRGVRHGRKDSPADRLGLAQQRRQALACKQCVVRAPPRNGG